MSFGGHAAAAGLSIAESGLDEFVACLGGHAAAAITESDLVSTLEVDGAADLREFPLEAVKRLEQLDPFGAGNPYPRFVLERVLISRPEKMGRNGEHLRLGWRGVAMDLGRHGLARQGSHALGLGQGSNLEIRDELTGDFQTQGCRTVTGQTLGHGPSRCQSRAMGTHEDRINTQKWS